MCYGLGMDEISELQKQTEDELGLTAAGWKHFQQLLDPRGGYGDSALQIRGVGEIYVRNGERLEIWWVGPESISKVIVNGKEYPHPTPDVIRMLIK